MLENLGIYLMGSVTAPYPSQEHLWGSALCVWVTPVCVPHCTSPGSSLGRGVDRNRYIYALCLQRDSNL